jgi:hypothetical protein
MRRGLDQGILSTDMQSKSRRRSHFQEHADKRSLRKALGCDPCSEPWSLIAVGAEVTNYAIAAGRQLLGTCYFPATLGLKLQADLGLVPITAGAMGYVENLKCTMEV